MMALQNTSLEKAKTIMKQFWKEEAFVKIEYKQSAYSGGGYNLAKTMHIAQMRGGDLLQITASVYRR